MRQLRTYIEEFLFLAVLVWLAMGVWRLSGRPMIQLVTPTLTKTVVQKYAGLPPLPELDAPRRER